MATFNYKVDTKPMADEMESVSRHVNATTGAVIAMQAAVIGAEERAANHVCSNVNRGFYSLIRSQISQKMAKLQSEVDSHFMELSQQKISLMNIQKRMEKDYNMIGMRYNKLFNGLNANLRQRVFELDKPTIDFALKEADRFANRAKSLTATIPVAQLESVVTSQKILSSNVKNRGMNVINSMRSYLQDANAQREKNRQIVIKEAKFSQKPSLYIPVAIVEGNRTGSATSMDVIMPDGGLDSLPKSSIKNKVVAEINEMPWKDAEINPEVSNEYLRLVSASSIAQREKDLMISLFRSSKFKTS